MKKKILMIDDDKDYAELLRLNLESSGKYKFYNVNYGSKGIDSVKKIRPDLILLDINMPDIDGFTVLKELKEHEDTISIPVVMLTSQGDDESRERAQQLYDEDYLTKPINTIELKERIDKVINRRV